MKHKKTNIILASLVVSTWLIAWTPITMAAETISGIDIRTGRGDEQLVVKGAPGTTFLENLTIQNTSPQKSHLKLYLQEAGEENGEFTLKAMSGKKSDMTKWVSLSSRELSLEAGETKSLPVSITFPENAGIGKHVAAIMTSQRVSGDSGNVINLDTGIRVHATVTGEIAQNKYKLLNSRHEILNGKFIYKTTIVNTGNTDLKGAIKLANQAFPESTGEQTSIVLKPGEDQTISLQTDKSTLGSEHIVATVNLNNDLKTFVLSSGFVFPVSETLLLLFLGLTITLIVLYGRKKTAAQSNLLIFVLVATASVGLLLGQATIGKYLQTNLFGPDEQAYLTTIKWGSFRDNLVPEGTYTNWSGRLTVGEGQMFLVENLHHEQTDRIQINVAGNGVRFKNTTGEDNDGIIVLIKMPGNSPAILVLHNNLTGEEIKIPIKSTLKKARHIQYKQQEIEIRSEEAPDLINLIGPSGNVETPLSEIGVAPSAILPIVEVESTPDVTTILEDMESSEDQSLALNEDILADLLGTKDLTQSLDPNITTDEIIEDLQSTWDQARLVEEIKLLAELIKDLPSSPDIIREYILSSSFISSIIANNNSTTVIGSSRLIRVLKDTPLIIREITSTPDSNFLFLPNDKLKLATQSFSFNERKLSSQELNEIIFVQKKSSPWTVYFSISDLTAISGGSSIAASNITFAPGNINVVSQSGETSTFEAGNERKITNTGDLIKLFSISPKDGSQVIFSMKPRISVFVPPKTLPGLYRAEITFKAI